MALSSDGKYLFVVANQDQTVQRINLSTSSVEKTFNFPPNNCSYCGMQTAVDLKVVPGSPENFVLALTGEVALYNSLGLVNYVPTTYSAFGDFTSFALAGSPLTIYSLPFTNAQSDFFSVITMNSKGLSFPLPQVYGVNTTTGAQVVSDGTLLYTSAGGSVESSYSNANRIVPRNYLQRHKLPEPLQSGDGQLLLATFLQSATELSSEFIFNVSLRLWKEIAWVNRIACVSHDPSALCSKPGTLGFKWFCIHRRGA